MPTPEELEVAGLLLRKAASDLSAARALARDPDQQDDVVGFRAQQAAADAPAGAKDLSPWAVATRYDDIEATLDRGAAIGGAVKSLSWARERVEAARGDDNAG